MQTRATELSGSMHLCVTVVQTYLQLRTVDKHQSRLTQQACEQGTETASRSCSCSLQRSHDIEDSSFCGK